MFQYSVVTEILDSSDVRSTPLAWILVIQFLLLLGLFLSLFESNPGLVSVESQPLTLIPQDISGSECPTCKVATHLSIDIT